MDAVTFVNWRKSSRSSGNPQQCVEVGSAPALRGIRDSKLGATSPILALGHGAFDDFLAAVKGGRFG